MIDLLLVHDVNVAELPLEGRLVLCSPPLMGLERILTPSMESWLS